MELYTSGVSVIIAIQFVHFCETHFLESVPANVLDNTWEGGFVNEEDTIDKAVKDAGRIGGGESAPSGRYPFQAGLHVYFGSQREAACGGSLVTSTRVITAAHCWIDGTQIGQNVTVVLGTNQLSSGGTRIVSKHVVVHPNFQDYTDPKYLFRGLLNDVAIIYLPHSVTFTKTIRPIALPSLAESFEGEVAIITGFGKTSTVKLPTYSLQEAKVRVISNSECAMSIPISSALMLTSSSICTKPDFGQTTCSGDSGGPLFVSRDDKYVLIGITSIGFSDSCPQDSPNIFTRITSYMDFFIQHNVV